MERRMNSDAFCSILRWEIPAGMKGTFTSCPVLKVSSAFVSPRHRRREHCQVLPGHSGSVGMDGGTPGGAVLHSLTYLCFLLLGTIGDSTAWL